MWRRGRCGRGVGCIEGLTRQGNEELATTQTAQRRSQDASGRSQFGHFQTFDVGPETGRWKTACTAKKGLRT